jgi:hypothetical protein
VKEDLKSSVVELFRGKPTVIPRERYDYIYFRGHYYASGIYTTVTMNFVNTKAIGVVCSRNINEIACE